MEVVRFTLARWICLKEIVLKKTALLLTFSALLLTGCISIVRESHEDTKKYDPIPTPVIVKVEMSPDSAELLVDGGAYVGDFETVKVTSGTHKFTAKWADGTQITRTIYVSPVTGKDYRPLVIKLQKPESN